MRFMRTVTYFNDLPTPEQLLQNVLKPFLPPEEQVRSAGRWRLDVEGGGAGQAAEPAASGGSAPAT